MKFTRNQDGNMVLEAGQNIIREMKSIAPISTSLIVDIPNIKETMKQRSKNFLKTSNFAIAPLTLGVANMSSGGVFWDAFLTYIFPWMLDIAKVYCLIRIAQAFYEEKRGGRDSGTGFSALIQHGKWYLVFWLLPLGVELIDGIGSTIFNDINAKGIQGIETIAPKP